MYEKVKVEKTKVTGGYMKFIGKLWRGEYPLWVHFWLSGCVVGYLFFFLFVYSLSVSIKQMGSADISVIEVIFFACFFIFPCYLALALRGIWLSADRYEGIPFWRGAAKFAVILVCIKVVKFTYEGLYALGLV